jgi:cell fate regulator YaaT (PSP1 superfamily)
VPAVIEVAFKGNRREFFTWEQDTGLNVGDPVLVPVERGQDLGHVTAIGDVAARKCGTACDGCEVGATRSPKGAIVRPATREEAFVSQQLRVAEHDVRRTVIERVRAHGLDMKVSDAEWQWDRKKLTLYFTADKRVDFRDLVRDLAGLFRTRIELRQIGARDESRRLDGVGRCGRRYCCSSWLPELRPVSLALAKDQRLSLNPTQISGGCGRLLCCLRYEHEFYVSARKRFPKIGRPLRTAKGREMVEAIDIFRDRVVLKAEDQSTRIVSLRELRTEVGAPETGPAPATEAKERKQERGPDIPVPDRTTVTTEAAVEAVTPRKRRRRRRPRRRGSDGLPPHDDNAGSGETER